MFLVIRLFHRLTIRGVARDKSMCRHHWLKGVRGFAPSENFDIQFSAAAFSDILRHILKETIVYFAAFAKLKKIILFNVKYSPQQN